MSTSGKLLNNVSGVLEIIGGSGATLTVDFDRGDVSGDSLKAILNETVKISRRGRKKGFLPGDRIWPKVSFTLDVDVLVGNSLTAPGSPLELMHGKGAYGSTGTSPQDSTLGAGHAIYTCDLRLTVTPDELGTPPEIYTWTDMDCTGAFSEGGDVNSLKIDAEMLGNLTIENDGNTVVYDEIGA